MPWIGSTFLVRAFAVLHDPRACFAVHATAQANLASQPAAPQDGHAPHQRIDCPDADYSDDLRTRASFGPSLLEPIGFAMDRRMLLGIRERVERRAKAPARAT